MRCLICAALLVASTASALSSHSPQDLYAFPKYLVQLGDWDTAVSNASAAASLEEGAAAAVGDVSLAAPDGRPDSASRPRKRLMRSSSGQAFLCSVPPLPSRDVRGLSAVATSQGKMLSEEEKAKREGERLRRRRNGLARGLALLEPMRNQCIFTRVEWFTYSFCYGAGEIRQFHGVMLAGQPRPLEDPKQQVYTLGYHISQPSNPYHHNRLDGQTTPSQAAAAQAAAGELAEYGRGLSAVGLGLSDVLQDESLGGIGRSLSDDEEDQKHYITQRWEGGTICDMTGRPRVVEVQYHCSTTGTDFIKLLREVAICEYLVIIHTPRLCAEPLFLDGTGKDAKGDAGEAIVCRPVVDQNLLDQRQAAQGQRERSVLDPLLRETDTATAPAVETARPAEPNDLSAQTDPATHDVQGGSRTESKKYDKAPGVDVTLVYDPDSGQLYLDDEGAPTGDEPQDGEPSGESAADTGPANDGSGGEGEVLEELTRVLRASFEGLLKDLRDTAGGGDGGAEQRGQAADRQAQQVQPMSLQDILAKLVDAGAGTTEDKPQEDAAPQEEETQRGGRERDDRRKGRAATRKLARPFPPQAGGAVRGARQPGDPHAAAQQLLQAMQQGRVQFVGTRQAGQQGARSTSQEHARLAKLYGTSFAEGKREDEEKQKAKS